MLKRFVFLAGIILAYPAYAQEEKYVPITIDEQGYTSIMSALQDMKYKDVAPIIQFLAQLEQRAQSTARLEERRKQ